MRPDVLALLPGPLDPADWWVARPLALPGSVMITPQSTADKAPYAIAWLASTARHLHAEAPAEPLVLVGHGSAGPLLPALARTQRAAGRRVSKYIFVDATLPRPGSPSHLDLLSAGDPEAAAAAHNALHVPGALWPPDAAQPQNHDFWTEALPPAPDWPDAPCAYARTGADVPGVGPTAFWARSARARGWQVGEDTDLATLLTAALAALPG